MSSICFMGVSQWRGVSVAMLGLPTMLNDRWWTIYNSLVTDSVIWQCARHCKTRISTRLDTPNCTLTDVYRVVGMIVSLGTLLSLDSHTANVCIKQCYDSDKVCFVKWLTKDSSCAKNLKNALGLGRVSISPKFRKFAPGKIQNFANA